MNKINIFFVLYILCSFASLASEIDAGTVYKANDLYDKGNYDEAIKLYESMELHKIDSADLFYNVGNLYFRNGELGKSIFYYEKAKRLKPRDANVKFNLNYAKEKRIDKIEGESSILKKISLVSMFSFKELSYLIFLLALSLITCSVVLLYRKLDFLFWTRRILFIFLIYAIFSISESLFFKDKIGVVIAEEAKVYSAIGRDNVVLFTIHEGTEFKLNGVPEKDWVQIELDDSKRGWIKNTEIISDIP